MITRRDLIVAALAAGLTACATAATHSSQPNLGSCVFDWNKLTPAPVEYGGVRQVCAARTATLDRLAIHITTLNPGASSHPPHRHPEEELVILKEGTLDAVQNGVTNVVGPGSIIFEASEQLHGVYNHGATPATYYVIQWVPPGGVKPRAD